ncbi:hypothetical protein CWE12_11130 [Aliidiomarina sedimenti]|uniref:Adhesin domain-containing protein n=1 Tax=Aliidiomarina sedimenti TaxID=1933879 RepID=A0ABY0BWT7_9GAMM|nr:DUF4097 family beta strand repeat-containing protein [Aliidiomarina sedimenti]RUO28854.1 hypothetical protein CWE12_11130 [Aliidiomarina sedimenti]
MSKNIAVALASIMLLLSSVSMAAEVINESREVSANERIYIKNMRGEVEIIAHDQATFEVRGELDSLAEGYSLESDDGFTSFEVRMPQQVQADSRQSGSRLTIRVPVQADVRFEGVNANVRARGIEGASSLSTVNGAVHGENLSSQVSLKTVNGNIRSENNQGRIELGTVNGGIEDTNSSGRVAYQTVNGNIEVQSQAEEVSVSTVSGRLRLDLSDATAIDVNTVSGGAEVTLGASSPRLQAQSVSGRLIFNLPATADARFSVNTSAGGQINNHLSDDQAERATYGPARNLRFSLGDGQGRVDVRSVSGTIEFRTRSE